MKFIEENPWTCILALVGLAIGLILPSGFNILSNIDYSQISKNPANFLTGFIISMPVVMTIEIISGLIGALLGGLIGLIIDSKNNSWRY